MDDAAISTINHARPRLWVETLWLLDSLTVASRTIA